MNKTVAMVWSVRLADVTCGLVPRPRSRAPCLEGGAELGGRPYAWKRTARLAKMSSYPKYIIMQGPGF